MIENINLENYTIQVNGEWFYLRKDLEAVAEASGRQKTYLRRPTKIKVFKELKDRYNDVYNELRNFYWFDQYKQDVEGTNENIENKSLEMEGNFNMNTQVLENLTKAIESISDTHKIEYAEEKITNFIHEFMKKEYGNIPQTLDVRVTDVKTERIEGLTHKIFPKILKLANMGKAIMISGPAGTGKNYLIEQVAKALGGKFYYSSTITQEYKLIGFIDANGAYHDTELRRAMEYANEHPDIKVILMIDEIDASDPSALVVINSLLANGYFDFPDKRVSVGKNFIVICAGNTVGLGADMVYTGRNVIDGATLDRFILVRMNYDTNLENALCPEDSLRNFIYDIRKSAKKNHVNAIVGMRCLKNAYEMYANDLISKMLWVVQL